MINSHIPGRIPFIVFFLLALLQCDVSDFDPNEVLDSPHIHTVSSSNQQIILHVYYANKEEYFTGLNVFLGANLTEITNLSNPLKINSSLPYVRVDKVSEGHATNIFITLSNDHTGSPLTAGQTWYIGVTAFDSYYSNNSPLVDGMTTNITVQ